MKASRAAFVALLIGLSGCAIADHYQSQSRMAKSQDAYRTCLVENTADPSRCEALRRFYEEDRAEFARH
jgi:hypothetical protein